MSKRDRLRIVASRALSWLRERGAPLPGRAAVVYHPSYITFAREAAVHCALDLRRPARIVSALKEAGVLASADILAPRPVSGALLARVHTAGLQQRIFDNAQLAAALHLGTERLPQAEGALIEPFLWHAGGSVLAVEQALASKRPVINLGGGFHHAERDRVAGFCPINDIAIAIEAARCAGAARRVLVVDLDFHQGSGTAAIFADDEDVFTLSIHGQSWAAPPSKENQLDLQLPARACDGGYLKALRGALEEVGRRFHPDLAIYIAGADTHEDDRRGGFAMSEEGILQRDIAVSRWLEERKIPYAVLLGGGYGTLSWAIPYNYSFYLLTGSPPPARWRPSNISGRYAKVHRSLEPEELGYHREGELSDEELFGGGRFLDYYTREGIELAMERYGFTALLREKGFDDLLMSIDTSLSTRHVARVHYERRDPAHLLIELAAARRPIYLPDGTEFSAVRIEWLLMQDPRQDFPPEAVALPGQNYPGLGLFRWFGEILRLMVVRLECDAMSSFPEHFHNGHVYGKVMRFLDPEAEGQLRAIERDLDAVPLAELTAAVTQGRVIEQGSGEALRWEARTQVLPVTPRLARHFEGEAYGRQVAAAMKRLSYRIEG